MNPGNPVLAYLTEMVQTATEAGQQLCHEAQMLGLARLGLGLLVFIGALLCLQAGERAVVATMEGVKDDKYGDPPPMLLIHSILLLSGGIGGVILGLNLVVDSIMPLAAPTLWLLENLL